MSYGRHGRCDDIMREVPVMVPLLVREGRESSRLRVRCVPEEAMMNSMQ